MILSFIIPCYNEAPNLSLINNELMKNLEKCRKLKNFTEEIIFIDDGSTDSTLEEIKFLKNLNPNIKFISFSRNFGKEAAILAGLRKSTGDFITIMDADLQHPPSLLPQMLAAVLYNDYDCAEGMRCNKEGESRVRNVLSNLFYMLFNLLCECHISNGETDYRMMSRPMVNAILSLPECNRFSKGIFSWIGFRTKRIKYENIRRNAGITKWNFFGLLDYSLKGILSFSVKPLYLGIFFTLFILILTAMEYIFIITRPETLSILPFSLFIFRLSLIFLLIHLSILGLYISTIFTELKKRPLYIIKETDMELLHPNSRA